jgi:hypothetical protein
LLFCSSFLLVTFSEIPLARPHVALKDNLKKVW